MIFLRYSVSSALATLVINRKFLSGICPVCLERGGQQLPCCKAKIHKHCVQDWIWEGISIECLCCKQTLPRRYIRQQVLDRFQCVPTMKANFIEVLSTHWEEIPKHCFFTKIFFPTGLTTKQTTMSSCLGEWNSLSYHPN